MKKYLSVAALLLLLAGAADAAPITYTLSTITYFNSFAPTPTAVASCTGCGTATAVDDGLGNITLTGIAWYFNAGGNEYNIAFDGVTTFAAGTTLTKNPGHTCVDIAGVVCDPSGVRSSMGVDTFYTNIASDNLTSCTNNRCRVSVVAVGSDIELRIRRALSESATSANSQTYTLAFTGPTVPVPGAVWLLGSALGALGLIRRKLA